MTSTFDLIVVGAGHAGCEAALAGARMGCRTLLTTLSLEHIALMPCNPSIGGPAKGHLVREVDALGGEMANNTDRSYLQLRMLNTSKGPAVQAPRALCDKELYRRRMWQTLSSVHGLTIRETAVSQILTADGWVCGVGTRTGIKYRAPAVIITAGVYLDSQIFIGELKYSGGPQGQMAARDLSWCLRELGFETARFRTTSPPRISRRTVDLSDLWEQRGSEEPLAFSTWNEPRKKAQLSCYLTYTNEDTHRIIRDNLERSPFIVSRLPEAEPRYCPSIESKVLRFPDRPGHQVFLEPEGFNTDEIYLTGLFTSLPEDVQMKMIRSIKGLERAQILRPGYGIEYDYLPVRQLEATLESKAVRGLFFAGQVNGTSGYEEAAAQGIMAGINAACLVQEKEQLVLQRSEAYIGVLIDDLVTKGPGEPYRMLTSRAEHRLLLRCDNADLRLAGHAYDRGLLPEDKYRRLKKKEQAVAAEIDRLGQQRLRPTEETNARLATMSTAPIANPVALADLLRRPEIKYSDIVKLSPPPEPLPDPAARTVEAEVKYASYIAKERRLVEQQAELEAKRIPRQLDYDKIKALSLAAKEKLAATRPTNLGQAARIPGITPADITVLMVYLRGQGH